MDDATITLAFWRLDTACLEHCEAVLATRVSATPADLPWYDLPPDDRRNSGAPIKLPFSGHDHWNGSRKILDHVGRTTDTR
jgi:hypothetical protein